MSEEVVFGENCSNLEGGDAVAGKKQLDVEEAGGPPAGRAVWGNKWQFLMSCVSLSVGLGNVWRFPHLVQKDGGGAFLIPYIIMMVLEGAPLFLLELAIGQRLRRGSLGVWNFVHPYAGGIGIASTVVSFMVGLYYNVIIAWCFYYLFNSFTSPLPFSLCPNMTDNSSVPVAECTLSSPTEYFWHRNAMDVSSAIEDPQDIKWWMALCLLLSWLLVYVCIMKGIQSSGKVVYVTALFPYLILVIFFGRAITLNGASAGLIHMFKPKMSELLNPSVWMDAATQVFYSLGLGFGSLIAFSSYNPVDNDCVQDALLMCAITVFTALFGAIDIFAVLGYKAFCRQQSCIENNALLLSSSFPGQFAGNMSADEYWTQFNQLDLNTTQQLADCDITQFLNTAEGTGLAFIVFTQAILELEFSNFWSIAFFLMLLALGLGSQFGTMQGVVTNLFDMNIGLPKELLTGIVCAVSFLIGLVFVTGAGEYWLQTFDSFAGTMGLVIVGFAEIVVVMYVYGHKRFTDDIEGMTGRRPGRFWQVCWRFVSPVLIAVIAVASVINSIYDPPKYDAWNAELGRSSQEVYPSSIMTVACLLLGIGALPIPAVLIFRWMGDRKSVRTLQHRITTGLKSTPSTMTMVTKMDDDDVGCDVSGQTYDHSGHVTFQVNQD